MIAAILQRRPAVIQISTTFDEPQSYCKNFRLFIFIHHSDIPWFFIYTNSLSTGFEKDVLLNRNLIISSSISITNILNELNIPAWLTVFCATKRNETGNLRVRGFFHKTVWVCQVNCNFKSSFTCRITVIFGTLQNGSLLINTLASNICFSYRNMFQNGVDALSKIVDAFLSKSSKFYIVWIIR